MEISVKYEGYIERQQAQIKEMRRLEKESDEMQAKIDALSEEITKEEVFSDYELMNSKCAEIDALKQKMDENFELLIEMEEE